MLKWSGTDSLGIWHDILIDGEIERRGKYFEGILKIKGFGKFKASVKARTIKQAANMLENEIHNVTNVTIKEIYERRYRFADAE